jgi:hypothetical protein
VICNPRIEHVDTDAPDDSLFIELTDSFGQPVQVYFTSSAALHDFVHDLGIVLDGEAPTYAESNPVHNVPTKRKLTINAVVH